MLELQRENALNPAQVEHYHKFMLQSSFYIELAAALPCATSLNPPLTPLHAPCTRVHSRAPPCTPLPPPMHPRTRRCAIDRFVEATEQEAGMLAAALQTMASHYMEVRQ